MKGRGGRGSWRTNWIPQVVALLHKRRDLTAVHTTAAFLDEAVRWNA